MPTGAVDLLSAPLQHLGLDPRHGAATQPHLMRKCAIFCHLLNLRGAEAGYQFHCRKTKKLDRFIQRVSWHGVPHR